MDKCGENNMSSIDPNRHIQGQWERRTNLVKDNASKKPWRKPLVAFAIHLSMESATLTFCFVGEYQYDNPRITCKVFEAADSQNNTSTPLSILLESDGQTVLGYGYDAERLYEELNVENGHCSQFFFKDIMLRMVKSFTETGDFYLLDENGKEMQAFTIFTLMVKVLKHELREIFDGYHEHEFYYVLIVPDIFQQIGAIDFMRKVAIESGINVQLLTVITEVDAVSVFHHRQKSKRTPPKDGQKFMVVNAGGYSTSIVVHETIGEGIVKESTVLETKEGGGRLLKKSFKKFCIDVFEKDTFTEFKSKSRKEWSQLKTYFLLKSITFDPVKTTNHTLSLSPKLLDKLKEDICSNKLSERLQSLASIDDIYVHADKVSMSSESFQNIIEPSVKQVVLDIDEALKKSDVEEIVVFGDFVKLPMMQQALVKQFTEKNITIYVEETYSALNGALIIGLGLGLIEKIDRVRETAIVGAIDFGTTYSGWAYSLRANFEMDRTKVSTKHWNSGSSLTEKTSTCILIAGDGRTVEAFGYEAEDRYQELVENDENEAYYYFRRFKMSLNKKLGEMIDRHMTLDDVRNRSLPAIDVFALSIKFLKDDLLSELQSRHHGVILKDDIHWVLTVPAIWTDGSKQFMREAAIKAGIKRRRLTIALEPEAASMYCRSLPIEATNFNNSLNISSLSIGTQYLVLDAGGGTIDITVHEICPENEVKEVHAACGGGWGGTTVDEEFKRFIINLVTEDVYEKFKQDHTDDWLDVWRDFEVKKRTINTSSGISLRLKLPSSLTALYYKITEQKLDDVVKSSKYNKSIKKVRDKITISDDLAISWFTGSVNKTVRMIEDVLSTNSKISAILMVGGFSESKVLQNGVRSAFTGVNVIVPSEALTCILKGALIFGHLPKTVTERVLKYTYGIESFQNFVSGRHPLDKRITTDKGVVCQKIFSKHAEINQRVKVGEPQVWQSYTPQYKSQKQISFSVYASEKSNPVYTDDACTLIGKLKIDLDDHDGELDREILVAFTFSGTEIVVGAKDRKTGNQSAIALDFLG